MILTSNTPSKISASRAPTALNFRVPLTPCSGGELYSVSCSRLNMRLLWSKLLILICFAASAAPLFAQSWRIADFNDTVLITDDGSALVKERINLVFIGEWHGIHRTIPVEYPGPRSTNYTLFLDIVSVTDGV